MSSATGPALHDVGGSFCKSLSSLRIRFDAMLKSNKGERGKEIKRRRDLENLLKFEKGNEIIEFDLSQGKGIIKREK